VKVVEAFSVSKTFNSATDSLVEIVNDNLRRAVIHDPAGVQVCNAHADRVAVANERELLSVSPLSYEFALQDHVAGLHVNLVENAQRKWPVLNDIGNRVNRRPKIDLLRICHCHAE
jgi:hypothetical protein